jgi:hypothetical protein
MTSEQGASKEAGRSPASRTTPTGQTLVAADQGTEEAAAAKLLAVPGAENVLLDLDGERLVKLRGKSLVAYLDWAPRLEAWWPGADGSIVYRVTVHGQTDEVITETLRDGTAWDQFDYAAGHDTRQVREALASVVKMQRRAMAPAPGFNSLGWHEIEGEWVYASADTVFGPRGSVTAAMQVYDADECALPEAPTGDRLREVVAASLGMLDAAVPREAVPTLSWVWLAPLISLFPETALPRFVAWTWSNGAAGVFGVFKSNYSTIAQAHSGAGYQSEADLLPAADTTVPSLAAILVARKDTLVLIDDYKLGETSTVSNKTQATAEQGLRLGTNRQNRQLRRRGGPGGGGKGKNMAMLWYTAESLPLFDSGSTHDRTFPVQVGKGDISADELTKLQGSMDAYPEAGAAYVAWLAANREKIRSYLAERFPEIRNALKTAGEVAGRACSHIAHMLCALEVGTRFAVEVGAMTADQRAVFLDLAPVALIENTRASTAERTEDQPEAVWLECLRALFDSRKYYAETPAGSKPQHAGSLGWNSRGDFPEGRALLGYATESGLAVLESVANGAIVDMARKAGKSLPIDGVDLRRKLAAHGVLLPIQHADGLHEHQHRHRIGGSRPWLPVVPWAVFLGTDDNTDTTAATGEQQPAPAAPVQGTIPEQRTPVDESPAGCSPEVVAWAAQALSLIPTMTADQLEAPNLTMDLDAGEAAGAISGELAGRVRTARRSRLLELATTPAPVTVPASPAPAVPAAAPVAPAAPRWRKSSPAPAVYTGSPAEIRRAQYVDQAQQRGSAGSAAQRDTLARALSVIDDLSLIDPASVGGDDEMGKLAAPLRLLAALEGEGKGSGPFAPYLEKRAPWWQAPMPAAVEQVRIRNWSFKREDYTGPAVVLDRSAAWPSAASSVTVAHGALKHTGPIEDLKSGTLAPGVYLVQAQRWDEKALPSPLPGVDPGARVWVPAPRMKLLRDLAEAGRWADSTALDSYVGQPVRLSKWAGYFGELRRYAREIHGRGSLPDEVVKIAFGQAMGLLNGSWVDDPETGEAKRVWKCKARRRDWRLSVEDQSAVNLWRAADECQRLAPDAGPLGMRNMDELIIPSAALERVTSEQPGGLRPAIRIDESGIQYGTFKTKSTEEWGE